MNKRHANAIRVLPMILGSMMLLASCSPTSGSASGLVSTPVTVEFYDDVGVRMGYSYVKPGNGALSPSHFLDDYPTYDYKPRNNVHPQEGEHLYAWDFAGFYPRKASGETDWSFNPYSVTSDCKLYASFKKKELSYSFNLKANGRSLKKEELYFPNLPSFPNGDGIKDETLTWHEENSLVGWSLAWGEGSSLPVNSLSFATGTNPTGLTKGKFYVDTTLVSSTSTDHNQTIYETPYDVYFSDGTTSKKVGSLTEGLDLTWNAKWSTPTDKKFTVKVYKDEKGARAEDPNAVAFEFQVGYLHSLTMEFNPSTVKVAVSSSDPSFASKTLNWNSSFVSPEYWGGYYTSIGNPFSGKEMEWKDEQFTAIQDDCAIFPVEPLDVHIYESKLDYLAGNEYQESLKVNKTGVLSWSKVGDAIVLRTSLGTGRLRYEDGLTDVSSIYDFVVYYSPDMVSGSNPDVTFNKKRFAIIEQEVYLFPVFAE